ncbi:DNA adenine methylase [Vibrio pectenicida]|uniref:site-specific DNA-methyltransferase (adenine-specific) n=1 Tax=Vibrio pectenicida TaxID=62763 RepID=A0A3R9L0Q4_9VIBR|nr:DNA adenine methylase [Vibrio pectenicida]RSD30344.1 DNA adenine methylase [Vibrio pectenicida]
MSYLGSKASSGAYQAIIANMPAHNTYIEAYLGTGVIFNRKPPALHSVGLELDPATLADFKPERNIDIYNVDSVAFLDTFTFDDPETTFIYADPPYLEETRTSNNRYRKDYTRGDHLQMLALYQRLTQQGVHIMISGYPSKLYDETLSGWRTHTFRVMTRGGVRTEKLWMNYEADSKHWAAYAGKNFTDRQRIKRKAARWAKNFAAMDASEQMAVLSAIMNA